jgi:hypothetical protein
MSGPPYEGGCQCGQVRWRATAAPLNVRVCHCRLCQQATGGPFFARAMFALDAFSRTGEVTSWPTSPRLMRHSCARCGTPLFATPNDPPPRIAVAITTCDDRHALTPDAHIWTAEKVDWVCLGDGRPQFAEGFRST